MKKGFSLLELLVVILIIGILAAVALPQYYKSKEKAEAVELQIIVKALHESQQRYYMVNNAFAEKFDELDVNIEDYKRGGSEILSGFHKTDCFSNNKNLIFTNGYNQCAVRKTGKYLRSGFCIRGVDSDDLYANKLYCYEHGISGFCPKLFNCNFINNSGSNYYYVCPS